MHVCIQICGRAGFEETSRLLANQLAIKVFGHMDIDPSGDDIKNVVFLVRQYFWLCSVDCTCM